MRSCQFGVIRLVYAQIRFTLNQVIAGKHTLGQNRLMKD